MTCACGFDNTPGPGGESPQKCGGCGKPLQPADDHEKPAPGFQVYPDDDSHVVTDADRECYPELENVIVIHELSYRWGNGIGADVYGYLVRTRIQVEERDDACPNCGSTQALVEFSQSQCGHAGGRTVSCNACEEVLDEEMLH